MRKNFKDIDIYAGIKPQDGAQWQKANGIEYNWKTPEHIEVKPVYTKEDLEALLRSDCTYGEFLDRAPRMNPDRFNVKGKICGVRIEEIEDPRMRDLRILDKLVDDLAKGKPVTPAYRRGMN